MYKYCIDIYNLQYTHKLYTVSFLLLYQHNNNNTIASKLYFGVRVCDDAWKCETMTY